MLAKAVLCQKSHLGINFSIGGTYTKVKDNSYADLAFRDSSFNVLRFRGIQRGKRS